MRFLKFMFAIAMLPFAWALVRVFVDVLRALPSVSGTVVAPEVLFLFAGLVAHFVVWMLRVRPIKVYVLGHELTHAIVALCFGARVSNLRVTSHGGSVNVSKTNTLITLAPYFFPFYTIIVVLLAILLRCFMRELPICEAWLFAVGYTWCFHLCFTIRSVLQEQPDIRECGYLFSYVLIWILNVVGVSTWLVGTAGVPWKTFAHSVCTRTETAYDGVWNVCRRCGFNVVDFDFGFNFGKKGVQK